jgi:NAD(P)-dependent dehydrogenase (short-subunit alcohol dehydrogenase family)
VGRLDGKVAIVTGGSAGIGRGIARAFAREGAAVTIAARSTKTLKDVATEIEELGGKVMYSLCDVSKRDDIDRTVGATVEAFGAVDVLVNNAHDLPTETALPFLETDDDNIRHSFEGGVLSTVHFMKACYPHMEGRGGSIINLGSIAGVQGWATFLSYAVSKEGIRALTRVAAREWGPVGIRVNAICPRAWDWSERSMEWLRALPEDEQQALLKSVPLGHFGRAERDIGGVAVFLASEDGGFLTGQTLFPDGGISIDSGR